MSNIVKRIVALKWGILGLAAVIVIYLLFQSLSNNAVDQVVLPKKEQPMIITNPLLKEYDGEVMRLRLIAEKAEVYEKAQIMILLKPKARLFNKANHSKTTVIKAEIGQYENKRDVLHLKGDVHIEFHDGQHLFTQELFMDNRKKVIFNTVAVKVTSGSDTINAASMRYTMNNEILRLKQPKALISF